VSASRRSRLAENESATSLWANPLHVLGVLVTVLGAVAYLATSALSPYGSATPDSVRVGFTAALVALPVLAWARVRASGAGSIAPAMVGVIVSIYCGSLLVPVLDDPGMVAAAVVALVTAVMSLVVLGLLTAACGRGVRKHVVFDALVVGAGTLTLGAALLLAPIVAAPGVDRGVLSAAVVLALFNLLVVAAFVAGLFALQHRTSARLRRVGLGLALFAAFHVWLVWSWTQEGAVASPWTDALGVLALLIAVLGIDREAEAGLTVEIDHGGHGSQIWGYVPFVAVMAVCVVLTVHPFGADAAWLVVPLGLGTVAIALARLHLAMREANSLASEYRYARTDQLTGLANRRALLEMDPEHGPQVWSLALLDLDGFKDVNDTLGHAAGDELLRVVAQRLPEVVRDGDAVVRLGGDEFAVVMPGIDLATATAVAGRIVDSIEQSVDISGTSVSVSASVGVAAAPEHGVTVAELLRAADVAMYASKGTPRRVSVYRDGGDEARVRLLTRSALRQDILEGRGLWVVLQPIVPLVDAPTSEIVLEALSRWRFQDRELGPSEFLPQVRGDGLMPAFTAVVLRQALQHIAILHAVGQRVSVSVNVSADMVDAAFVADVAAALAETDVPADALVLEITDDAVLEIGSSTTASLAALRSMGVRIWLDDFGTGWSGLTALRDEAIDGVKLHRSFVLGVLGDRTSREIVRATVSLANALDLTVIAEGIEEVGLIDALRDMGCDAGQGYGLCRPLQTADVPAWLGDRGTIPILPPYDKTAVALRAAQRAEHSRKVLLEQTD